MGEEDTCQIQNINFVYNTQEHSSIIQEEDQESNEVEDEQCCIDKFNSHPDMPTVMMIQCGRVDMLDVQISFDQEV